MRKLPVTLEDTIWWDVKFFRMGNTEWCLILLVDARGTPLAWKLGKSRTKDDFLGLLRGLGTNLTQIPFSVGDGLGAYQKVCKELGGNATWWNTSIATRGKNRESTTSHRTWKKT